MPSAVTSGFWRSPWVDVGSSNELNAAIASSLQVAVCESSRAPTAMQFHETAGEDTSFVPLPKPPALLPAETANVVVVKRTW